MKYNVNNLTSGLFFLFIGIYSCFHVMLNLPMGTAFRMGPGYFPFVLGCLLSILGVINISRSFHRYENSLRVVPWRGVFLIGLAPVVFGLTVRGLGFGGALFLTSLIAAYSYRQTGRTYPVIISLALTVFCLVVFSYGLRFPIPIFGPWLRVLGE